jgi:hypothetical protein
MKKNRLFLFLAFFVPLAGTQASQKSGNSTASTAVEEPFLAVINNTDLNGKKENDDDDANSEDSDCSTSAQRIVKPPKPQTLPQAPKENKDQTLPKEPVNLPIPKSILKHHQQKQSQPKQVTFHEEEKQPGNKSPYSQKAGLHEEEKSSARHFVSSDDDDDANSEDSDWSTSAQRIVNNPKDLP